MRTTKLMLIALAAATALAALAGTASARNLSLSNQHFRVSYSSFDFVGPTTVRCGLTLEGSFHARTIAKVVNTLLGYITRATVRRPCTNGTTWIHSGESNEALGGTFSNRLPWHLSYGGFAGTLPNIAALDLVAPGMLYTVRAPFFGIPILCEYQTTNANGNARLTANREAGGGLTTVTPSGTIGSNTGGCPSGRFSAPAGDGRLFLLGTTTRITLTLI